MATYEEYTIVTVSWYQNDGTTLLYQKDVPSGWRYVDPVSTGEIETPSLESSVEYDYTYTGWDSTPTYVTGDISIYATYSKTGRKYTVRWHNYGGATLYTLTTPAHGSLEYPGELNLTRPPEGEMKYLWLGEWDHDTTDVTCDLDCYPVFIECVHPGVAYVPNGWYIYSDNPDDNMVYSRTEFAIIVSSDLDTVKQYLSVGDKIKMCLSTDVVSDTEIVYQLHGFKHYRLADGSNDFAPTTWHPVGILASNRSMNTSSTNAGGWPQTVMRDWLNNTLYYALPAFWRCLIKKVNVLSSKGASSSEIVTSADYLYLMSQAEVGFSVSETPYKNEIDSDAENVTFALYTDNNSRIKKTYNGTGSAANWWLRSPAAGSSSSFYIVNNYGNSNSNYANNTYGVCPGFSI